MAASPSLAALAAEARACRLCRDAPQAGPPLPHEPRPVFQISASARLLVAGQAPGTRVHASGRPFTDPSGVRLRRWMGVDAETFYDATRVAILPMGFCFPGQNDRGADLPPRRECAPRWRAPLLAMLPRLELVLALGLPAVRWHAPAHARASLSDAVAAWRVTLARARIPRVLPLPHPSWRNHGWLRAHPWFEAEVLPVLRAEIARLVGTEPLSA